jgi:hypothetical protein
MAVHRNQPDPDKFNRAVRLPYHSRTLVQNRHHNGHPDLVVQGKYPNDAVKAGTEGVEIKTTLKAGGAVHTHAVRGISGCASHRRMLC